MKVLVTGAGSGGSNNLIRGIRHGAYPVRIVGSNADRYALAQSLADKNYALPANHSFWTRPLMNRSWRNEIMLDNIDGTALLMTGRCGRGKVAVLATAVDETAAWDQRRAFWSKTLDWLKTKDSFEEDLPPPIVPSADESLVASMPGDSGISLHLLQSVLAGQRQRFDFRLRRGRTFERLEMFADRLPLLSIFA